MNHFTRGVHEHVSQQTSKSHAVGATKIPHNWDALRKTFSF